MSQLPTLLTFINNRKAKKKEKLRKNLRQQKVVKINECKNVHNNKNE